LPLSEVFRAPSVIAVFVPKGLVGEALSYLSAFGFAQVDLPAGVGSPNDLLEAAIANRDKWNARLDEIEGRLEKMRERYAGFVVAAEEALEIEVDKAEAPLRFAVSDHSFVIDGWIPSSGFRPLHDRMDRLGIYVESGEPNEAHATEAPPVLLRNPRPVRPFEFLIQLYSTPSYQELDPTLFLFIAAPFFFGFMVGDVGYGALFVAMGVVAAIRLNRKSIWWQILFVTAVGGVWSVLFGLFVFGEAFGLPFHPATGHLEELSWESFGLFVPIPTLIHKAFGIGDMIYLSILFASLHLGTGYVIGFVNEVHHNKKHAIAKLGWFMCLFGLFTLLTYSVQTNRIANWVWAVPLGWFPRMLEPFGLRSSLGIAIPLASLLLILGAFLGLFESVIAPIEVASLLANILSYMRLAGIGIGKAAIAAAFNVLILKGLVFSGQVGLAIFGVVCLVLAQTLVFLLGWISAGIQALRLNYFEAFIKFFKGNGIPFRPFGIRATQEV
ncbi:MAG TPA: V-type ATPase 116kDa subunit family protein, partial [Thermoplasmata archaeon]|nr:V-type ATPase 116kDa subunit family protein [Thermoplasmata archaeon]